MLARLSLAALALLALSAPAHADDAPEGETMVSVSVLSAPKGHEVPGQEEAADVAEEAEAAPMIAPGSEARIAVRTADTLGPAYRVTSLDFQVGQQRLPSVTEFETQPKKRKKLKDGPQAVVDARADRVRVKAVVRGFGSGDFAWLNNYEYTLTSFCPVTLQAGEVTQVDVVVVRDAGPMADFGKGLAIECGG